MTARGAVVAAVALCATACGAPLMKLPAGPGAPAADGRAVLEQATATCARVSSVSAEVGVSGSIQGRRIRGRILAGLAAPSGAYLEAPAPFGAPVFIYGANEGAATLLLPRDRRVLQHDRPAEVLGAIAGITLDPAALRRVLTGCVASDGVEPGAATALGPDWRLIPGASDTYVRRERSSAPWRIVSVVSREGEGWRADYADFAGDLPRRIRLTSREPRRFDLRLTLSDMDVNVPLDPATFRVPVPAGTQPMTLDELRDASPLAR